MLSTLRLRLKIFELCLSRRGRRLSERYLDWRVAVVMQFALPFH
jgi:hypothetical protein